MTEKHTPGPWVISSRYHSIGIAPDDGVSDGLATVFGIGPQAEANARLIAAAPELLKALKQYREAIKDFAAHRGISLQDGVICEADDLARAAIVKATGKEQ